MNKKLHVVLCLVFALLLSMSFVVSGQDYDPDASIVFTTDDIPSTLDPMWSSALNADGAFRNIFDTMFIQDPATMLVSPHIINEYSVDESGLVWTLIIRDDVVTHAGEKITAEDLVYSFERIYDVEIAVPGSFMSFLGAQIEYDKSEIVDDLTWKLYTKSPTPGIPYILAGIYVMDKSFYEALPSKEAAREQIMGTGPYYVSEYVLDDHITLERFDDYWMGPQKIKTITFREIKDVDTRLFELQTGGVDAVKDFSPSRIEEIDAWDNVKIIHKNGGCRYFIGFNHENPKWQNKNVRLALNYAVDWDTINTALFGNGSPRLEIDVNPPWNNPAITAYQYDPEKAKSLIEGEGYILNAEGYYEKDGEVLGGKAYFSYPQTSVYTEMIFAIADQYRKQGILLEPVYQESNNYTTKLSNMEWDDFFYKRDCSTFDGLGDISHLAAGNTSNYGRWNDAKWMELYNAYRTEMDADKAKEIFFELQQYNYDEAPIVFLTRSLELWAVNEKLVWEPSPDGRCNFRGAYVLK